MADRKHPANDAWEALLTAHSSLIRKFNAQDVWGDLSMKEYDVLYTLSKCPKPVRLSELNRHVLLSQPALSRLVDRLAERGLVDRCTDPADGRGVRLSLTAAGRTGQRQGGGRPAPPPGGPDGPGAGGPQPRPHRGPGHDRGPHPRRTWPARSLVPQAGPSPRQGSEVTDTFRLAVVSAGNSDPSSTRLLADRIADRTVALAA